MLKRIMVPLDGSERAERGLAMAARLARATGSELLLVRVVSIPPIRFVPYGEPAQIALALIANAREAADEYLKRIEKSPLVEGITVEARAIEGHVTGDLLEAARIEHCDLIVLTTHGYSGFNHMRLGRVAQHVARHSVVPVLVLPVRDDSPAHPGSTDDIRMLVTLDGSSLAEAAVAPALELGQALAAPERISVHLLQVVDFFTAMMSDAERGQNAPPPEIGAEERALELARLYLTEYAERIRRENPHMKVTSSAVLAGDAAKMICDIAGTPPGYDFVAMATHGRGGLQRWAMGSTTERVLHAIHLPLLIVRSPVDIEHDLAASEAAELEELHR